MHGNTRTSQIGIMLAYKNTRQNRMTPRNDNHQILAGTELKFNDHDDDENDCEYDRSQWSGDCGT